MSGATNTARRYNLTVEKIRKEVTARVGERGFVVVTRPYFSTRTLTFLLYADSGFNAGGYGWAVAQPQELVFFDYHAGSTIRFGSDGGFMATEAETNLVNDRQTNASEDFAITGIGMSQRGMRVTYANGVITSNGPWGTGVATDATTPVGRALRGLESICDPAAIVMPAQGQSPFNLEEAMFTGIQGLVDVTIEWDNRRKVSLGTMDLFPQGGARSLLRANGVPTSENRYDIPEGYKWGRTSGSDAQLVVRAVLRHPLIVPLNLVIPPLLSPSAYVAPTQIDLEIVLRAYGMGFAESSENI
jgi:hypothetical protein